MPVPEHIIWLTVNMLVPEHRTWVTTINMLVPEHTKPG